MACNCKNKDNCDCLPCHFDYEEEKAFPYLPVNVQIEIKRQHDEIRKRNYPPKDVLDHANYEMQFFQYYLPREMLNKIDKDHCKYEEGLRDYGPSVPPPGHLYVLPTRPRFPFHEVGYVMSCPLSGTVLQTTYPEGHNKLFRYPNWDFFYTIDECKFVRLR